MIYVVRADKHHKIGHTARSVHGRIAQLQTANPYQIDLVIAFDGDERTEARLHAEFASKRVAGEWFELDADDINKIHQFAASAPEPREAQPNPKPIHRDSGSSVNRDHNLPEMLALQTACKIFGPSRSVLMKWYKHGVIDGFRSDTDGKIWLYTDSLFALRNKNRETEAAV